MNNFNKAAKVCCIICVVLMLGMLVLQIIPYWTYSEGNPSIAEYVWRPHIHKELTKEFRGVVGRDYEVNQIVLMPVSVLASSVLGVIMCIRNIGKAGTFILPIFTGAMAVYGFLAVPIFSLGTSYVIQIIVSGILLGAGILGVICSLLGKRVQNG